MMISLSEYTLQSASFELRYAPRFMIWDRSGSLWARIADVYSGLAIKTAEPNQVLVRIAPDMDAFVGAERAHIAAQRPDADLVGFKAAAGVVVPAMIDLFDIEQFSRIGLRLVFGKRFADRQAAADFVTAHVPMPQPKGRIMNIEGKMFDPHVAFRWEGDSSGFMLHMHATQQQLNFELPAGYEQLMPAAHDLILNQAIVDIDYYIHSQVSADQVRAEDLIENWLRLIKRDIGKVLND